MSVTPPAPPTRNENVLIFGMAISQVIAIGCLFHSFTLFLAPLQKEFGWTATQIGLQELLVEAVIDGDRDLAFRALLEDPLSPADEVACRAMFDELCELQADLLPF